MDNASLSSLELRIESIKRFGNLQNQCLESVFNRLTIAERYRKGEMEVHIHVILRGNRYCIICRSAKLWNNASVDYMQFPVFVRVRQLSENFEQDVSSIRLQPLNSCAMRGVNSLQPGFVSLETIYGILDRKLSAILNHAGIEACKLIDKIVKGSSKVVDCLTDQNPHNLRNGNIWHDNICRQHLAFLSSHHPLLLAWEKGGHRLTIDDDLVLFSLGENFNSTLQVCQVFPCPVNPFISAVEWVHKLYYHYGVEGAKESLFSKL